MKQLVTKQTLCPIDRAASLIADRWTILILRELRMGNDRFHGIQAQTGMSSNLLTQRLKRMEENGLIERRLYQERPKRYAYGITEKTRELDGMMLAIRQWGMRQCGLDPKAESAVTMRHRRTGAIVDANWQPGEADLPFSFSQLETRVNPGWAAERAARAETFAREKNIQVGKRGPQKSIGKSSKRKRAKTAANGR